MKHKIKLFAVLILVSFSFLPKPSYAIGDEELLWQLIQNYHELKHQYDMMRSIHDEAQKQVARAKQIATDAEGHYGFGKLLNDTNTLKKREWSPGNWKSALKGLSGGNAARYQELVSEYKRNHPSLAQSDFSKGATTTQAKQYEQAVAVNRAASVNATYAFNNLQSHLETVHTLSSKIDEAPNAKAATDLNSRLLSEVAYIQAQELKMQVLMNQQMASSRAKALSEEAAKAKFNAMNDE